MSGRGKDKVKRRRRKTYMTSYYERNKEKKSLYSAERKDINKNNKLKRKFGITLEDYNQMFDAQQGCCTICGKHQLEFKQPLFVEHNHDTGKVCGLTCSKCNTILAFANDDINILLSAIEYLKRNEE